MVLQAYIDDSLNDESGIYALAGYISTAEKWANFSREWEERLPLAVRQPDGSYRFKMSEMAMFGRMENVSAFHNLIVTYAEASIACVINNRDLKDIIDGISASVIAPNGQMIDINIDHIKDFWGNPFYLVFYLLMDNFSKMAELRRDMIDIACPVDFYFDDNSQKEPIRRGWDDFISTVDDRFRKYFGTEPRFESDDKFLPLQAADFRAWWITHWATEHGLENIGRGEYPFPVIDKRIINVVMRPEGDQLFDVIRNNIISEISISELKFFTMDGEELPSESSFIPVVHRGS